MNFINHIIEPNRLLLTWQSLNNQHSTRHVVAELIQLQNEISLTYLLNTTDFNTAKKIGFESYPAFPNVNKTYNNIMGTFMRRLPPRSRLDFPQYLDALRLPQRAKTDLSDFALLGYSGAKLLSDGFSIIHPFETSNSCEALVEVAEYRDQNHSKRHEINTQINFTIEDCNQFINEKAIKIEISNKKLGYITRGLIPTFTMWLKSNQITEAVVEKISGSPTNPDVYIFVTVAGKNN